MTLRRKLTDGTAKALIYTSAFLTTATLVALIAYIMIKGILQQRHWILNVPLPSREECLY